MPRLLATTYGEPDAVSPARGSALTAWRLPSALLLLGTALLSAPLAAHVQLNEPNGGETLMAGDTVTIVWQVNVQHSTQNWDLWYSTSGAGGPWKTIAVDLPVGNGATGSVHTFDWMVPSDPSEAVRVRVRQDNTGMDYEDLSDDDLSIEASGLIFADGFESGNTSQWP